MEKEYIPPQVWALNREMGGTFSSINLPTSGARVHKELPKGEHPLQLYSMATPNGVKVTILLEELLGAGISDAEYDAYTINIGEGDQFGSGFVEINPNSKIPALLDCSEKEPIAVFESGSILLYLAEKFDAFIPKSTRKRTEVLNWLFWQMGAAPFVGGGFGHFYAYAPEKIQYAIDRYTMEVKRQLDVLDKQLNNNTYITGEEYTIADMALLPWYGSLVMGLLYDAQEFISAHEYKNVIRWAERLLEREAVLKGRLVNRFWGDSNQQLLERHSADDFIGLDLSYR